MLIKVITSKTNDLIAETENRAIEIQINYEMNKKLIIIIKNKKQTKEETEPQDPKNIREKKPKRTNQLELKNIGAVLGLGPGLNGRVLIAQESIVLLCHGEKRMELEAETKLGF